MSAWDFIMGFIFAIMVVILFWLYLFATPDQCSAECEYQRSQMERSE